jgi:eukaryotic-like serine/threonine-protein kinase
MSAADPSPLGPQDQDPAEDSELVSALEACLAEIEAGRPVDLDRLAAGNPSLAGRLRTCLAGLHAVEQEGVTMAGAVAAAAPGPVQRRLGDYTLLREIGRGGMGVVYEAEQVSLGRRVALKVLPIASSLDPRSLQRFHNEARAAAGLRHPNIVPIFAVGCEHGVHFYVMQYVEGRTLRRGQRRPGAERGGGARADRPAARDPGPAVAAADRHARPAHRPGAVRRHRGESQPE